MCGSETDKSCGCEWFDGSVEPLVYYLALVLILYLNQQTNNVTKSWITEYKI